MSLEISKQQEGSVLKVALSGNLDTLTSPLLEAELDRGLDGVNELIFDFNKLDYISSAGLRVLLSAQKTMNAQGSMKITGVNETVGEIFEITGFCDFLTIE